MHSKIVGETYDNFALTNKFESLDGLRAVAILAVLWHHAGRSISGWSISNHGFFGVDLFFVISGFLIVTLLLREQRTTKNISLKKFYVRRCLRIFPAYYFVLLFAGLIAFFRPAGNTAAAVRHDLPFALFFVANLVPMQSQLSIAWSLAVEEQFYLIAPTLIKFMRSTVLPVLLFSVYLLICLPPLGVFSGNNLPTFFIETTFGPILLGALLAIILDNPTSFRWAYLLLGLRGASIFFFLLMIALANWPGNMIGWPRFMMHWTMVGLVGSCVVNQKGILDVFLALPIVRRIGVVSYGIYLYHLMVMHFVVSGTNTKSVLSYGLNLAPGFSAFVVTALGSWIIAEISFRFFESPFLNLRKRYR